MKKSFLTILVSLFSIALFSQTADEIISKYSANMGGLDAFNKVKSVKITGTFSSNGVDLPLTSYIINGKAVRTDIEFSGQMITNCYYNGKGWKVNPLAGISTPTEVTGTELADLKAQSNISSQLMDYKARGNTVELKGEETVEGIKTYKIQLTAKEDGKVTYYFISATDYSLIKSITNREIQGQSLDIESFYSDLKTVDGIKFYMARDSKIDGQVFQTVTFSNVEINVPIDEKIFEMK